ncbi:hypothetical protein [Sphaerotilus sp.]|uniref:hypothetical protein n=1 Tax=Sphaerotilus sp. TaxID=2093942 RepID=UPI002ACE3B7E|nr:hypothetical protein [Sphaerotilus sp.]MDZ7855713.1 hypothetical protein [Sphaerotilus sp.]
MFRRSPPANRPDFQHSVLHAVLGELTPRGARGGRVQMHRSIWGLHLPPHRLAGSVLLALVLTALLVLLRPTIAALWSTELLWWVTRMELSGRFTAITEHSHLPFQIATPTLMLFVNAPLPTTLMFNAIGVVAAWWLAGLLPDVARPGCYLLRFAAVIHGAAVLFFWIWPASFPHSVNEHIGNGLQQCWALMLLAPWIHLCTYYLFAVTWLQRLALTLLTWAYLFVLAPLLFALHALVLHAWGPLAMPLLHLLFGVMVTIIGFVALYGWAMGWANARLQPAPIP